MFLKKLDAKLEKGFGRFGPSWLIVGGGEVVRGGGGRSVCCRSNQNLLNGGAAHWSGQGCEL